MQAMRGRASPFVHEGLWGHKRSACSENGSYHLAPYECDYRQGKRKNNIYTYTQTHTYTDEKLQSFIDDRAMRGCKNDHKMLSYLPNNASII
jgi:hypothetical protein